MAYPREYGPIDTRCPKCQHEFPKASRRVEGKAKFDCPKCGFESNETGFLKPLEAVREDHEGIVRDIRDRLPKKGEGLPKGRNV